MKPIEQTRREFLRAAGKGVLGAAALTAIPSVLKPALAETAAAPAYPWTYQQVDKDAVLKHTYDCFYSHGGCCAAVFAGIMETMGEAYGAPYNVLNGKMFANGAAGYGVASLCGSLGGACAVIGLFCEAEDARARHQSEMPFPIGAPNDAFAQYFVGQSYLQPLSEGQPAVHNVSFEPGCRNNWHIHHAEKGGGQLLICVAGRGWYQEWGKPARALAAGDVVNIPAGVKHWHGAAADSWFSHLAMEIPGEGCRNEWLEPVSPEAYESLN